MTAHNVETETSRAVIDRPYSTNRDEFALPAYLGYSAGHWEKDTFVVETAGFNDKTVLDGMGHPHSESLRVVERLHRRDFGHLDYEITFDDPEMYTKPFTVKFRTRSCPITTSSRCSATKTRKTVIMSDDRYLAAPPNSA